MIQIKDTQSIKRVEKVLGYTFSDKDLLIQAFTRSSYRHSHPDQPDNEVLEFRGDSLLRFHVTEHLLKTRTKTLSKGLVSRMDEGDLSKQRDKYVENAYLAKRCEALKLHTLMRVESSSESEAKKTRADLFEALIGVVYTDAVNAGRSTDFMEEMVLRLLDLSAEAAVKQPPLSDKPAAKASSRLPQVTRQLALNMLTEYCVKEGHPKPSAPTYTDQFDKQHSKHTFTATIKVGKHTARGQGPNQKTARQEAAIAMLCDVFKAARR